MFFILFLPMYRFLFYFLRPKTAMLGSAFAGGAVRERDRKGRSVWRWREKKAFGFLQFSEMEERERVAGFEIFLG